MQTKELEGFRFRYRLNDTKQSVKIIFEMRIPELLQTVTSVTVYWIMNFAVRHGTINYH